MTAEQAQHAALAVELAAKNEDFDSAAALWPELVAAIDRLRPELAEFTSD